MNTGKQINAMVVVLFLTLVAVGAYTIWDPFRSDSAKDEQVALAAERGAHNFALNCRLCHGDRGEGGSAAGRLGAALPLDRPDLQGIKDGAFDQVLFDSSFKLVTNTITCGRAGTLMPTWGQTQGGTLNNEQIRQLAVLITEARWDLAQRHADELDAEATGHATVQMPNGALSADETELIVSNAGPFALGQYVRIGDERLRVLPIGLEVERGVDGTETAPHGRGALTLTIGDTQEPGHPLTEAVAEDDTVLPVHATVGFAVGDVVQIEDERVRVTAIVRGIPSTGQLLIRDIGRTPKRLLVSGAEGIEQGEIIRIGGELMEVKAIRRDGDADLELDGDVSATATELSVNDPAFLRPRYQFRLGDELLEVVGPVETSQTLSETVGRAETRLVVSGTEGVEEGTIIRLDSELLRVVDIVQPARVAIERGVDETAASAHPAGTDVLNVVPEPEEGQEPADPETGQALIEALGADDEVVVVTGTAGISPGQSYRLGDEIVQVTEVEPAVLRVQRSVDGTERASHGRRVPVYDNDLIEVERGVEGTGATAHGAGDELRFAEIEVKRAVEDSEHEEHAKNAEIFLGNRLIVARGAFDTEPAEHKNGVLVFNFPTAPEPAETGPTCGQVKLGGGPTGPTPTPLAGAQPVAVSLDEWSVTADPAGIAGGPVEFTVTNDGTARHNFRVIHTDLAPDALPLAGLQVDEGQLEVVGGFTNGLAVGDSQTAAATLAPGSYVLICNVPTHYDQGMAVAFEVTAP